MKFCVLASGSKGNCTLVSDGATRLLVDCGISCRRAAALLGALGVDPATLGGICVTHDHVDHVAGLATFHKRFPGVPVYATQGTCACVGRRAGCCDLPWRVFAPGGDFAIGGIAVHPFATPHDAADSVGFVFTDATGAALGYATDLGYVPSMVQRRLAGCSALVLESNHDRQMLRNSGRPWSLIERIAGNSGHLSNEQSAELVDALAAGPALRTLVLAHLSGECNTPAEALGTHLATLRRRGREGAIRVVVASPDVPTPILEVLP